MLQCEQKIRKASRDCCSGMKQPIDVVVRGDQQRSWIAEGCVVGEPLGWDVAMWRNDGKFRDSFVKLTGQPTGARLGWKKAVRIKLERCGGGHKAILLSPVHP